MKQKTLITILSIIAAIVVIIVLVVVTSGKNKRLSPSEETDEANLEIRDAQIGEVEVAVMESFPVQVAVTAYGELPDNCTTIHDVVVEKNENNFDVNITTEKPRDAICDQAVEILEETFPLDVRNLLADDYTVNVNGIEAVFTLNTDNFVEFDAGEK